MTDRSFTEDEIDDAIDEWLAGPDDGVGLREYLGWTAEEMAAWSERPDSISVIALRGKSARGVHFRADLES